MPPYGEDWKRSLLASDYELYRRLGELLHIVPSSDKALQLANEQKYRKKSFNLIYPNHYLVHISCCFLLFIAGKR